MALMLSQKSNVRRHLRYPLGGLAHFSTVGGTLADGTASYRYYQPFSFLEWRMNNLAPDEEARLTGNAYAALSFVGPSPDIGSTYTVTFSGGLLTAPATITATINASDIPPNPTQLANSYLGSNNGLVVAGLLAQAANLNTQLRAAQIQAVAPFGTGAFSYSVVPIPEIGFTSPQPFTILVDWTGNLAPSITADGTQLHPMMFQTDGVTSVWGYLNILNYLETEYGTASRDLSTSKADVWKARPTELAERFSLYSTWQNRLAEFIDVPINPNARTNLRSTRPTRFY